jgi:transketolase
MNSQTRMKDNPMMTMDEQQKEILQKVANTIRHLSIDGVQKANSGHPGLPMGCAELGAYLYGKTLRHNPKDPTWIARDRFVLSAGHGSMFLYSCLHLAGFDLSLEELKRFRQLHSKTPGHPEFGETPGVETTTGPLGQGIGCSVGQALGLKMLGQKFNTAEHQLFNSKVYCLCGDGCMMEGISHESCSLAGHLKLDNLVLIYDSNNICLDGPVNETFSDNTRARFEAYGWEVYEIDGHDLSAIDRVIGGLKTTQRKPTLVIAKTIIGKGAPNKAGTHKVHGSPLGPEEVAATKVALGLPNEDFFIPQAVKDFFKKKCEQDKAAETEWRQLFDAWAKANKKLYEEFEWMSHHRLPDNLEQELMNLKMKPQLGGRSASQACIQKLAELLPQLVGGSADLSCSDLTKIENSGNVAPGQFSGKNIKFGVREFGMAAMASGICHTEMFTPFVGTFLCFSDYMRNAVRLAALMKIRVIYQFTHDSIFLGEDGPTHQPVEHYASLRTIPNLHVIRPGDNNEVKMAWLAALKYDGPTALILTRQNCNEQDCTRVPYSEGMARGAYIVRKEKKKADFTLFATGSELQLALDICTELERRGKNVRVVSVPCVELFEKQDNAYKQKIVGGDLGKRVSIEAGVSQGWHRFVGIDGVTICQDTFGASAPAGVLAEHFGFTVKSILDRIL